MNDDLAAKHYLVSIMATQSIPNSDKVAVHHSPSIIPATAYIDGAADAARQIAFEAYPLSEGFSDHEAYIIPATNQLVKMLAGVQALQDHGMVVKDNPEEKPARYQLLKDRAIKLSIPESEAVN